MTEKKVCVYAICKNESKYISQWLDSMQEADYIVVLDTGSTDNTVELLQNDPRVTRVETQVISPWRFDVARNESMKLVPEDAEILVCTDFDELFQPGWYDAIRKYWADDTTRMHYTYAWSHTESGEPSDIFKYDKIHTKDYYWKYPVHEVLFRDDYENERCIDIGDMAFLHHYQDTTKPRGSYFDLLKLSCAENPEDSHTQMLLAREYLLKNDKENALQEYLKTLNMADVSEPNKRLVLLESLGRCADLYYDLQNYDEAIWYAQEFIKEDATYKEPYHILCKVYVNMGMYTLAEAMLDTAEKYSTRKDTWVERANSWTYYPDYLRSIVEYHIGDIDRAIEHANKALTYYPTDLNLLQNSNKCMQCKLMNNNSIMGIEE